MPVANLGRQDVKDHNAWSKTRDGISQAGFGGNRKQCRDRSEVSEDAPNLTMSSPDTRREVSGGMDL